MTLVMRRQTVGILTMVLLVGFGVFALLQARVGPSAPPARPGLGEVDGCYLDLCVADLSHPDARYVQENYGLVQLTDDERSELGVQLDGDLVVWLASRREWPGEIDSSDIMGMNITSRRLIPIGVGREYHQTSPYVAGGRVVFAEERNSLHPDGATLPYLAVWDRATNTVRPLETGLGGEALPGGFDGSWVVFRQRFSIDRSNDGLWALHVDDGRKIFLHAATRSPAGDAYEPVLTGETIADGRAYYAVSYENQTGGLTANATLFEVDLETGHRTIAFTTTINGEFWLRDADENHVVWEFPQQAGLTEVWVWSRPSGEAMPVTRPDDRISGRSGLGGDWVVYRPGSARGVFAYHVPTRTEHFLAPTGNGHEVSGHDAATDGVSFVVDLYRVSTVFETFHPDIYFGPLPTINPFTEEAAATHNSG